MNIFLDDTRLPTEVVWLTLPSVKWKIIKNYEQFINAIKLDGIPEVISFDHDLGIDFSPNETIPNTEKTGLDCAKWLVDYCLDNSHSLPTYYVHSLNPIGKQNILNFLNNAKKHFKNQK
jgi:hypothetical protein